MSKWKEPLPKHTKINYDECYAKIILSRLLSQNYEQVVLNDKPDLQFPNGSNGIEVTQALDSKQQNAESLYTSIQYGLARDEESAIKEIKKCSCKYKDGILIGKIGTDSFALVLQALKGKLETINKGGYVRFATYDLFIFSDIYANDTMRQCALYSMIDLSKHYELFFEKVMVLVPGSLYIFNLPQKQIQVINYSNELQYEIAIHTRELVEEDM